MAITPEAYLKVGLGCVPEDMKREMLEKRPDTTAEWRVPIADGRDQTLSEAGRRASGQLLTAANVQPRRGLEERYGQGEIDDQDLATHPAFLRFAEIIGQLEWAMRAETGFEESIADLEELEAQLAEFDGLAEKRIRRKVAGAKQRARLADRERRSNPAQSARTRRRDIIRHKRTSARDKRVARTAVKGTYRRADVESPPANMTESYTGRMQPISDSHLDIDEQRRLAGLTPSRPRAAFSTSILDARRPTRPMTEDTGADLAAFKRLAGL